MTSPRLLVIRRLVVGAVLGGTVVACSADPPVCSEIPLGDGAVSGLPAATAHLDFPPQRPCAFDRASTVTSVSTDVVPGQPPEPRITYVVSRQRQPAFVLSETRAEMRFWTIPMSTHSIQVTSAGVVAKGFAGYSGTGVDTAYLRWSANGVTFELGGTLRPAFSEGEFRSLAAALMAVTNN